MAASPRTRTKVTKPMGKKMLAHFEQRLLEERKRLLHELGQNSEMFNASQQAQDGDLTNYPFHMADQGTDTEEQEKQFLFASQEGRFLAQIDDALRRLYHSPETFGICENCGEPIDYERLDAIPYARFCIRCKEREPQAGAAS
ncbi:MAG TPA: TraR/DksA C4-type zinc finger protein [Gemmatimonadaceae bacterium]